VQPRIHPLKSQISTVCLHKITVRVLAELTYSSGFHNWFEVAEVFRGIEFGTVVSPLLRYGLNRFNTYGVNVKWGWFLNGEADFCGSSRHET
jgi:hypothetical protein